MLAASKECSQKKITRNYPNKKAKKGKETCSGCSVLQIEDTP